MSGFTVYSIRTQLEYTAYQGLTVDSLLLQFGICYGGSTRYAMDIHNYLRGLGLPVRAHVLSITAGTVVALATELKLEHTAQWTMHRPMFVNGSQAQRSEDIRTDADRLDQEKQQSVALYVASTGQNGIESARPHCGGPLYDGYQGARLRLRHQGQPSARQGSCARRRAGPPRNRPAVARAHHQPGELTLR